MSLIKVKTRGTDNVSGRRNIAYNGAMRVAQRGTSQTGISSAGYYTVDRFRVATANSAGRLTMTQETITDLPGFTNAIKFACTSADTSIAAGEYLQLSQYFEGQDLQQFKKGTSSAEKVTVSFYVKGNGNATYMLEMFDGDNTRHNTQQFSVTSSWNRVSLTFDGDTTGAYDDDNALSLYVLFWLHTGDTYSTGSAATTWASVTNANRAVGVESIFTSADNELFITGVQLEVGFTATPFEHRSPAEEQQLCFRYTRKFTSHTFGRARDGDSFYAGNVLFQPPMRATPTLKSGADFSVSTGSGGSPTINTGQGASGESLIISNGSANWTTNAFARLTDAVFEAEL